MDEDRSEKPHSRGLNGLRIPLLIDGVMFLSLVVGGTLLWADVKQLQEERLQRVSAERIAILEGRVDALVSEVRRNDTEGQRDRARIWQQLDRDREGARR